jgi:hypothetical protein
VRVLFDFITSSERTRWLFVEDKFKVFVRKTKRLYAKPAHMEGRLPFPSRQAFSFDCIDIGSIEIQPGYQNKGVCTRVFDVFERITDLYGFGIYVENVLNPTLAHIMAKRSYFVYGDGCYIRHKFGKLCSMDTMDNIPIDPDVERTSDAL